MFNAKSLITAAGLTIGLFASASTLAEKNDAPAEAAMCNNLLDYSPQNLRGKESTNLCSAFKGKVILAVNTASECGFTPQFEGLEALYQKYKDQGLVVLGFPSNDFFQEHKDSDKTADVCYVNYGVTFPVFKESAVRGSDVNPFFKELAAQTDVKPKWNFYKYLIARDGSVIDSFGSRTDPMSDTITKAIEAQL